jgi:hypothetical protein
MVRRVLDEDTEESVLRALAGLKLGVREEYLTVEDTARWLHEHDWAEKDIQLYFWAADRHLAYVIRGGGWRLLSPDFGPRRRAVRPDDPGRGGLLMDMFDVSLFDETDKIVGHAIPMPCVPQQGWKLIVGYEVWDVTSQPQVILGDRSRTFRPGTPIMVNVRVRPGIGIHKIGDDLDPLDRYEYARRRYENAAADYPRALVLADQIMSRAAKESEDAERALREFEEKPGIPKPEFRERM